METKIEYAAARNETRQRLHRARGEMDYHLEVFGDALAQQQGYKDLDGMEALRYYLMLKHGWLPRDVLSMSSDDVRFALHQELQGWTLPAVARP